MSTYLYCGQLLESNIIIPELSCADHSRMELFFELCEPRSQIADFPWAHHWLSLSGVRMLSYCKSDYHWLRFPHLADFRISLNAKEIFCYPLPEIPEATIRHLLLDQILPRCLAHQGILMLHASAARLRHGAILFLGDSGVGKSTLAGSFHQAGFAAVSDDCISLRECNNEILAVPSYGGLRLWEDSLQAVFSDKVNTNSMAHFSSKKRVILDNGLMSESVEENPILSLVVLSPIDTTFPPAVRLEKLSHRETFIAMLKQSFQLDLNDIERMKSHVHALGSIVPRLLSFQLSLPHDYALLPIVRQKLLAAIYSSDD